MNPTTVPLITSIKPAAGLQGTTVSARITGANLTGATGINLSGTGVTGTVSAGTDSNLPVNLSIVTSAVTGLRSVTVSTPNGTSTTFNGFAVRAGNPIRITAISPQSALQGSTFSATVVGRNLDRATGITFSGTGVTATISASTATTVSISIVVAPTATNGIHTITVTTTAGISDEFAGLKVNPPLVSRIIAAFAGTGTGGFSGDGGLATAAQINGPFALAVDGMGTLFIGDFYNHRIRKVTPAGIITTVAGNGSVGSGGDGGPATSAQLTDPIGLAVDSSGNLFIADSYRVRKVSPGGIISTVAGTGAAGFSGDGGPAILGRLNNPLGIAVDNAGNLFIADRDNSRIRKVDSSGIITTVAGTGGNDYSGDGELAVNAELYYPTDVAIDGSGNLFIADTSNSRIRVVVGGGIINTFSGNGVFGSTGNGGPATSAQVAPSRLAADGPSLFIVESSAHRVRRVARKGRGQVTSQ